MGCCGQSRREFHTAPSNPQPADAAQGGAAAQETTGETGYRAPVGYEYIGTTSLTVRGSATGNIYRFRSYGDRVAIDARDVASIDSVPNLRRV